MYDKVLAVIVTYHPDIELLNKNISALLNSVAKVVIWENSPEDSLRDKLRRPQISFMTEGENVGISVALNKLWRYAKEKGYDYLLTMDQDSVFNNCDVFLKSSLKLLESTLAVLGPCVSSEESIKPKDEISVLDTNQYLITSGTLVPLEVLDRIGGYNESFKIDGIDVDFCIRVQDAGFRIFLNNNGVLLQHFGEPYIRVLFGKEYICPNYNPSRIYGIIRNHVIVYRKTHRGYVKKLVITYVRHFSPRIILWENKKISKLYAIIKGLIDGLLYKL